ncbi:UvrD-helicase domain-containing protein, partial [bacterium]|nr:UvrD-helicase domain-containing protein [bacterium]
MSKCSQSIANSLCNKSKDLSFLECFTKHKNSIACPSLLSCRIEEKSIEQLDYIMSSIEKNIYLSACPGSGKTETLALKCAYEFIRWNSVGGIAVLTFTSCAASVISDRVSQFTGKSNCPF